MHRNAAGEVPDVLRPRRPARRIRRLSTYELRPVLEEEAEQLDGVGYVDGTVAVDVPASVVGWTGCALANPYDQAEQDDDRDKVENDDPGADENELKNAFHWVLLSGRNSTCDHPTRTRG